MLDDRAIIRRLSDGATVGAGSLSSMLSEIQILNRKTGIPFRYELVLV